VKEKTRETWQILHLLLTLIGHIFHLIGTDENLEDVFYNEHLDSR